jgi:nucleotide-binding universal stress UspA family protein
MFERILLPLDGSSTAEAILPKMRSFLMRDGEEALVLHVLPELVAAEEYLSLRVLARRKKREEAIRAVATRLREDGVRARSFVRTGDAASTILSVTEEQDVSLIAMTTHGCGGLPQWTFGSVTEKVLRASAVSLFLLPSYVRFRGNGVGFAPALQGPFRKILVPIDGSECAGFSVPAAAEFAKSFCAGVTLLHVTEVMKAGGTEPEISQQLSTAQNQLSVMGVEAEVRVVGGSPAEAILHVCDTLPADIVAMAAYGSSGASHFAFGSVTEKVLRSLPLPVLLIRPPHPRRALKEKAG